MIAMVVVCELAHYELAWRALDRVGSESAAESDLASKSTIGAVDDL